MIKLHKEYLEFLEQNSDKERADKEKAYLYSECKHYGVSTPKNREFTRKHKKELQALDKKSTLQYVEYFWSKPSYEEKNLALTILNYHKNELSTKDMPLVERLMSESRGWVFLDNLIIPLMPTILERDPKAYSYLKKWIKDDDYWVRRSALLAQILFFRENKGGNKELFFELAKSQFDESWINEKYKDPLQRKRARFFIRKAMGWSIREISNKDPKTALNFLKKHKKELSGLSFRDGSRKLPVALQKELKNSD
ncbi:DNA alkylation repair protein [Patescibacteria group bacterium]|nr:DNA alkylation repair protein [Patescibacteria group bacterium]